MGSTPLTPQSSDRRGTCFVIAPIGDEGSDTRKRSDQILKYVVTPSVEKFGYVPLRADAMAQPGLITSQVIQQIIDAPLVVADLTDRNPNVFYELALRHAIRKPLVQLIRKGEPIPFDVAGMRTVAVDIQNPDSVAGAVEAIVAQIEALHSDPSALQSPISVALDLQALQRSDDLTQRAYAEIMSSVGDTQSTLFEMNFEVQSIASNVIDAQTTSSTLQHVPNQLNDIQASLGEIHSKVFEVETLSPMFTPDLALGTEPSATQSGIESILAQLSLMQTSLSAIETRLDGVGR